MANSDLDILLDMGFDKARADIAIKKPGGREFMLSSRGFLEHSLSPLTLLPTHPT